MTDVNNREKIKRDIIEDLTKHINLPITIEESFCYTSFMPKWTMYINGQQMFPNIYSLYQDIYYCLLNYDDTIAEISAAMTSAYNAEMSQHGKGDSDGW